MSSIQKLTINGSWTQFIKPLRNRESFDTHGSLRGRRSVLSYGMLPNPWLRMLVTEKRANDVDYVVYSYNTPIAWHVASCDVWVAPDVRYSVTTSKSQGKITTAISVLDDMSY